jgi:hypothetical protein
MQKHITLAGILPRCVSTYVCIHVPDRLCHCPTNMSRHPSETSSCQVVVHYSAFKQKFEK